MYFVKKIFVKKSYEIKIPSCIMWSCMALNSLCVLLAFTSTCPFASCSNRSAHYSGFTWHCISCSQIVWYLIYNTMLISSYFFGVNSNLFTKYLQYIHHVMMFALLFWWNLFPVLVGIIIWNGHWVGTLYSVSYR